MEYQKRDDLVLPEYGRNIQKMVDYALIIEDRDERTQCAKAIINTMGNLFPVLKQEEHRHKLWDHLAIMSKFQLDIDWPYEIVKPENLVTKPEKMPYNDKPLRHRHYGRIVMNMVDKAVQMEDGEEKTVFINTIANHMKKCFVIWNKDKDDVSTDTIVADINELSEGKLHLTTADVEVRDMREIMQTSRNNKKNNYQDKRKKGHRR